ncbi:MAG: methionyl-tRNA formyltransferase [Clostridiaceae bacterium]|nr:methionyl-tRNA formyltransferase [Clostridiaceae bacterium]
MRVLFMGTPDFAVPSLKALVENGYKVIGVVTQADRPKGRGYVLTPPPVKEYAVSCNIPVYQPGKLSKEPDMVEILKNLKPDVIVTCAFGQILPQSVLDIPKYGTINVHGSLLPKYRGAAPIHWAIINGESKTGITTMYTDIGLDTGDMLLKDEVEIPINMTVGELHDVMSLQGAKTLIKTLQAIENGTIVRTKQDDSQATYAPKVDKETGHINWNNTARKIHDTIRGTTPWPGAWTELTGLKIRVWSSKIAQTDLVKTDEPGTILDVSDNGMLVKTMDASILIKEIQAGSGKRMTPKQYACGHELKPGMKFD